MTEIYNEIKNRQKDNNSSGFDAEEFLKSLDIDKTQDIDNNFPDKTQPVVVEPQQIEPQRKSYFLQNSQKEINTTAQQPNEIEYEADIIDNPKNKDNYFGLTKLEKDKPSIFKAALESATKYNPLTASVAVKNKLNEITGKNDIELSLEAGRGFAASGVDFGSAVYRFFKQNIDIAKTYTKEQLDRIANKANVIAYGKEKGDFSAKIDEKYNNFYKQIEEENKYLKDKTEKFLEYSGLAKDDNDSFVYDLAGGGASLLFALGLVALTKSPAAAAELFGAYQYQSLYEESIEKGFSPIKARSIGVLGGAAEAGLEMFGLHTLIETLKAKRSFTKIAKSFVIELTQEASQQTAEEMLAKWTGLRDSTAGQIWHNIWYAGIIGGILGGGAGAIGNIVVKATDELVENGADKQKAQKAVETVIEAALSQETADEIKQIDKDEQSPVTYTNADPRETYREFGDTVKNVLKSDQARGAEKKLLELKQSKYEERKKHYLEQGLSQDEAEKQAQAEATMYDVMARNRYESGEDLESIYNDIQIQQAKQEAANNGFDTTVPEIKQKWDDAKKIGGDSDTKYMNDNVIDGQYFLVEAETPTASHNPNANFQPTTGFPQTADGKTVNDRDYFNDKQAQAIVITTAQNYDSRAIDDMPIVSFEGVVVSGNQRTMASQLAAQNNTDGKYIEYLYNHCKKFGFSPEQVAEFKHPRVVFVPNESLDYDTQTFAAFNASEKKTQGSVEKAVSLGKRINDETIEQIANIIDKFDTLAQLHDSPKDIKEIVRILSKENIINNNELASLTDTTSAGDLKFSAIGKDFLENLLLGTALKEQTIRDLTHLQAIRAKLVKCILPLVKNKALPKEYQLQDDIEQATRILTAMKKENFKTIADFTAQQELFGSNIEYDKNIKKLAHLLTLKYGDIKSVLTSYNQQAADNGAYGNSGLFGDSVQQTKNDILDDIFNNNKEFADVFFQQGYHGGGKDFDNFDLNFVLTGEGYNVHGWGVYVTANKKIAEDYRKRLSDHNSYHTFIYNGKKYTNKQIAQFKALSLFKQFGKKQALKTMNEILNNKEYWQYYGNDTKNIEAAIDLIKGIDRQSQIKETYGQTYKVDIPDNDVLLDEQKYFKEQPAKVQEALRKIGDNLTDEQIENLGYNSKEQKQVEAAKKFYKDMVFNNDYTGQGIYETITGLTGGDTKQASLLLKQYGIKGITYYGKIDGRGYVIFDDKSVKVVEKFYQPAYHGTPHKFDSFSTDKIGSGEGAAAHGWGLYFAENKNVSESYRKELLRDEYTYNGKRFRDLYTFHGGKISDFVWEKLDYWRPAGSDIFIHIAKVRKDLDQMVSYWEKSIENYKGNKERQDDFRRSLEITNKEIEFLNSLDLTKFNKEQGQLFKVDIPEKDVLLDEQKRFDKQPEKVKNSLKELFLSKDFYNEFFGFTQNYTDSQYQKLLKKYFDVTVTNFNAEEKQKVLKEIKDFRQQHYYMFEDNDIDFVALIDTIEEIAKGNTTETGKYIYSILSRIHNDSDKGASLMLSKYGIKGITYDGRQDGRCYVVFDDKAVKVIEKFYQPAYHGTPHKFDSFSTDKIGSGEGAAAHGWGLYFTEDKNVADYYKFKLTPKTAELFVDPKDFTINDKEHYYTKDGKFYKNDYDDTNEKEIDKAQYSKALRKAQELNKKAIEEDNKQGQLLKVDIPEKDVLLDEQKQFWEQPVKVQEALKKIANKYYINLPVRGLWIYRQLVKKAPYKTETEKQKWASLILKQYGIKGITYDGRQDGRCYVIFDDKALNILETYYQNNQSPRGATTVYDRQYYVDLFSNSDKSTLMHELAHIYLADLNRLAKKVSASKKVRDLKEQIDLFLGEPENDGRYSTEQQEKFAINFESYLKNGQAPNAKLKNVFERFAKWLADIYDTIKDSLPTINNEVKSLFDKILSDSYFVPDSNIYGGKAEAIKKVIENIKQGINSEVDGITITDVERLLKVAYTRKPNKPSKNLLQLLKSKNIYDFNDLDKAGNKRVQEILKANGYIDDKVTEEQAVELAKAALDGKPVYRLADNWRTRSDTDFRRNLRILEEVIDFNDIDMVLAKIYDLQNAGYRQVEQQDVEQAKQAAQQVNSASLDNAKKIIKEVIEKIRRKQFIDSAAKKELLQDLESSQTIEEIRESVGNIIEDLQAEVDLIKDSIKTQRKPKIRKDKTIPPGKNATQEEKNTYKKYMKVRIDRLLKQALPRKQNQQKFSKFDVQTQRFFNNLQVWNNKTLVEIQQVLYDKAMNINDEQGEGLDNFSKIENMFLSYKAHKVTYHSVDFYKQLYDSLQEINVFGRNTKDIENTLKKEQALQDRQDLIDNIEKNKSSNAVTTGVKKQYIKWLGNWYSTINAIAGKGQAEKDSLEKIEIDIFNANYKKTEDVKEKCKNALGLKNTSDLDMVINNYLKEEYTYSETDAEGYTNNIKLNKMQLICCYIWLKNDTLKDRIIRAFGNIQVMDMINKLTLQDQKFGDELQQAVADLYDDINKVYLKMYGLDLPQAQNYFPSNVERIQGNMDLLKDNIAMVSSPGFIKARVDSHLPLMNFGNPVKIALDHIAKVNHFVYMQEKLAQLNKIYKATIVKRHIVNNYGDRVYAYILQVLDNAKFQTVARTIDGISDIGNYLVNNYVLTKIAIKPSIMIKQLLSCINYIEDIDSTKWFSGFLKGISSPKETIKFMMTNSKYCKARFEKGGQTEALLKAIEGQNATFAKVKTFKGMLSYMTRVGDIGAIIFGGYPMIQAQLEKGIDLKTAIENFEKATVRSQQASLPSTLSNWQYRGMNSWLYRAMFAFANTPNQYCRKMADSMYMYYHGDIDKKQLAKNLMIYGVFNPLLYTSFTSLALLTGIVSGDWDDLTDDIIMSLLQCSNVLALPIISQAYNSFVARVITGKFLPDKEIPLLDDMVKIMKILGKDELEFNDWLNITDEAGSLVLGVPVKTLYNEFVGSIKDLLDGEYGKFIVKVYGATESRANKIFD